MEQCYRSGDAAATWQTSSLPIREVSWNQRTSMLSRAPFVCYFNTYPDVVFVVMFECLRAISMHLVHQGHPPHSSTLTAVTQMT